MAEQGKKIAMAVSIYLIVKQVLNVVIGGRCFFYADTGHHFCVLLFKSMEVYKLCCSSSNCFDSCPVFTG